MVAKEVIPWLVQDRYKAGDPLPRGRLGPLRLPAGLQVAGPAKLHTPWTRTPTQGRFIVLRRCFEEIFGTCVSPDIPYGSIPNPLR